MSTILVVDRAEDWPLTLPGVELVAARKYLTDPRYSSLRGVKVFNLCRSYRYQSLGYYVSLLAAARNHRPLPSVATIQDLKTRSLVRFVSGDLEELIGRTLAPLTAAEFTLSIYFGKNVAQRYQRLALHLFNSFPAPLLRAQFLRRGETWELASLKPIAAKDVPADHWNLVFEAASEYFQGRRVGLPKRQVARYDLAILVNPEEERGPSDEKAIQKFVRAGNSLGLGVDLIGPDDFGRLSEYDALFIRETTRVNHHTYRFARRAAAEGLVVVDDPASILRCTNKVFLAERLTRAKVNTPRTVVVHRDNVAEACAVLGVPNVIKMPDSSFSLGVFRVEDAAAFEETAQRLLADSDLLIAQEFLPTAYDWRVGILDRQPLYVCRYFMAEDHWQIVKRDARGRSRYGRAYAVPVDLTPKSVIATALRAANLIGDGLYGVDVKQVGNKSYVIEINDNPSLEAEIEDGILGDQLYLRIMRFFLDRIEKRTRARNAES